MTTSLPAPLDQLWNVYQATEVAGGRLQRMNALTTFLDALQQFPTEAFSEWAYELCRQVVDGKRDFPIRLPLFRDALFAPLLAGVKSQRPGCARWLGALADHLNNCPKLQAQLASIGDTKYDLLKLALRHDPDDNKSRLRLIQFIHSWLEYALHVVPCGVLCDRTRSVAECCKEYLDDTTELESLATQAGLLSDYQDFIQNGRIHFQHYPIWYAQYRNLRSYADYLEAASGNF